MTAMKVNTMYPASLSNETVATAAESILGRSSGSSNGPSFQAHVSVLHTFPELHLSVLHFVMRTAMPR